MKFSYDWLQELIEGQLPKQEELGDFLSLHSYECEGVSDDVIDLDILPNRAHDSLCHVGIAREIAILLKTNLIEIEKEKLEFKNSHSDFSLEVEEKDLCRRYCALKIGGVKVEESPDWLKKRLSILGLNSINSIVDIGNYVMLLTGQPMHIFDADKIDEGIIVRNAKEGERIDALDDKSYSLKSDTLVIADKKDVLAIAGIKGGKKAEIDLNTQNIIIEAANFDPYSIRKTSRALHLSTDASYRFERMVPLSFCEDGISIIAKMIKDMAGGEVLGNVLDVESAGEPAKKITLDKGYLERILGCKIASEEVDNILTSLGFAVEVNSSDFVVTPPDFRLDVVIQNDVIEEIARIKGYDSISSVTPNAKVVPVESNNIRFAKRNLIKSIADLGFFEIHTISFVETALMEKWGVEREMMIQLENPLQENVSSLRPSLLPNGVNVVLNNLRYEDKACLFEIGKIFSNFGGEKEYNSIAGIIASKEKTTDVFYELKGTVECIFDNLGIKNYSIEKFDECNLSFVHPRQSAQIKIEGSFVGMISMLHPHLLGELGTEASVSVFEMKFDVLLEARRQKTYKPVSKYPKVVRDISMFVDKDTTVQEIEGDMYNLCEEELVGVELFDYRMDEDKLGVAFHLIFQRQDRTLKSEEIEEKMEKVINFVEKEKNWKVR